MKFINLAEKFQLRLMGCDYPKYTRKTKFCEGYLRIVAVRRCRRARSLTVTESQPIRQRAKRCWLTSGIKGKLRAEQFSFYPLLYEGEER